MSLVLYLYIVSMFFPSGPFQDKCGQDLFGDRGAIASPNYPNKYPDNINCVYKITRPHGQVALSFLDFEMESHGTCKFDHISVSILSLKTGIDKDANVVVTWHQLCRHWWHRRLSLWLPCGPVMMKKWNHGGTWFSVLYWKCFGNENTVFVLW